MTARLLVREGPEAGAVYALGECVTTLGRGDDNDLVLAHEGISWHHAEIRHEAGAYQLVDRGSKNGTWLNGRRLAAHEPAPLAAGDVITFPCRPPLRLTFALRAPTATVDLTLHDADVVPAATPGLAASSDLTIDLRTAEVWARGRPVQLTAKEFRTLAVLYEAGGALLSKHELAERVWPEYGGAVGDENIEQLIARLRRKLEEDPAHPRHLLTLRGLGYRLVP